MRKIIYIISITFVMVGCVSQADYDKLKEENLIHKNKVEELEFNLINVKNALEQLLEEKRLAEVERKKKISNAKIERNKKKYRTESEALSTLKDYYEFYNADRVYRNPKVRRVDNNTFKISLQECRKMFRDDERYWRSKVMTLEIKNDGTYNIK